MCVVSGVETTATMPVSAQLLCTRPRIDVTIPGITMCNNKLRRPAGAGPPADDAVEPVDIGHAVLKTASPIETPVRVTLATRRKMSSQILSP
ncbi:unnamed protein product [Phytophthora fragariaefolia]|uniref:Unnamed protein product n=1 Tax=Phytophthora fragariaefolia TaxID=1490495 RepID=A0A9W6Y6K3_9STRA|nr:unnamed protein product [Phytophthora fragariaefolia]